MYVGMHFSEMESKKEMKAQVVSDQTPDNYIQGSQNETQAVIPFSFYAESVLLYHKAVVIHLCLLINYS